MNRKPVIHDVTFTYFRSGKCERAGCTGSQVERSKSFTGATEREAERFAERWMESPLMHKRCEGLQ